MQFLPVSGSAAPHWVRHDCEQVQDLREKRQLSFDMHQELEALELHKTGNGAY